MQFENEMPRKCSAERRAAARRTMRRLNIQVIRERCIEDFAEYIRKVKRKKIVLAPNSDKDFFGETLYLDYKTRFTDTGRKVEALKKYEHCWDNASAKHKTGVLLTLTIDPKLQTSLWDCNRKASSMFNKLLSNITRKKGERPEYVNVFEFQKNGRVHLHVMLFGLFWVMPKEEMVALWKKYGMGEIIDFLSVKNDGDGWTWTRKQPRDADGKDPIDYLKKYLKKGLFDPEKLYQYWIYNTRFFSYSRKLCTFITYHFSTGFYVFLGTVEWDDDTAEQFWDDIYEEYERLDTE